MNGTTAIQQNLTPVLQISGTDYNVVPIYGTMSSACCWGDASGIENVINYWANSTIIKITKKNEKFKFLKNESVFINILAK